MNASGRKLIFREEAYPIISCALEVLNGIAHRLHEKSYEKALAVESRHRGIPYEQQRMFPVTRRNLQAGSFVPDLTRLPLGLIINFKKPKLEWERIVLSS